MSGVMGVASGQPVYSGSLIKEVVSSKMLANFHCHTMIQELTTGNYLDELRGCGDRIRFQYEPKAMIHCYVKNQKLEIDQLSTREKTCEIGKGAYWNLKMDHVDLQQICNSAELLSAYTKDAVAQIKSLIEYDTIENMMMNVDPHNQGCCAGVVTGCYDLGDCGKARMIDCNNILKWMTQIFSVLMESCTVTPGHGYGVDSNAEPFIILPIKGWEILMEALSKGCCLGGDGSNAPMVTGRLPNKINNFHIYVVNHLQFDIEGKKLVYPILAGRRDATGFVTTIEHVEECKSEKFFGKYFRGLQVWGSCVMYPEALALSRVCFKDSV
jgi:hypothetical protein